MAANAFRTFNLVASDLRRNGGRVSKARRTPKAPLRIPRLLFCCRDFGVTGNGVALIDVAGAALAAAVAVPLLVASPAVRADPVAKIALVLKVVDGDTIDIRDDVRGRLRIRVLGIDTPETKKPGYTPL